MENHGAYDLNSLLSNSERDFLVKNNGEQVNISALRSKTVGLYFSGSWCGPCRRFTPDLIEVYNQLLSKGDFEIIFISSDKDDESFNNYFSKMPWLAVPFSDSEVRKNVKATFEIGGIPSFVILDHSGKVITTNGREIIDEYGMRGYPFTHERIKALEEEEEAARRNQTLQSILVSGSEDFVVKSDGTKVPISDLEGKTVGLYFLVYDYPPCREFTEILIDVYQKLRSKGEDFEIVLVPLDEEEAEYNELIQSIPWLSLPLKANVIKKLIRYFELSSIPTLVVLGPDGKTLLSNAYELVQDYGIEAYPFNAEKVAELEEMEKVKREKQTLESLLVSGELDFVINKNGTKVSVSELVGKTVLFYFSAHWCPPCRNFTPKLIEAYNAIKVTHEAFEIVFISSDEDQKAFDDYYSSMPWLALPFGDKRKGSLGRTFKVEGIPSLVAIGPSGRTLTTEARSLIENSGPDAYPFGEDKPRDDSTKEKDENIEEAKGSDSKEEWVCDGDVCRKA